MSRSGTLSEPLARPGKTGLLRVRSFLSGVRERLTLDGWLAGFVGLLSLVLLGLMARPLCLRQVAVYFDLGYFHLPIRDFYARCLQNRQEFDWLSGMHNGVFITGEGEHGPYHPFHLLLYSLLPLDVAFASEVFLSFPLMFLGTFLFLRPHAGRAGSLLGAMVYTFSANNVSHGHHINYVAVLAHLPWLLWLLEKTLLQTGTARWRAAAGVGLLTGSQVLLGHPQMLSYSLLAEGLYALFLAREVYDLGWAAVAWCMGKVLGLAVGGVQLLATLAFLAQSNRGSFDPLFGAYTPSRLLQILVPNLMCRHIPEWCQEPTYFGAVALVLLLWWSLAMRGAVIGRRVDRPARRLTGFAVCLGMMAGLLAIGEYGGLYRLQTRLPIVGQFRAPARYVNLVGFAAAVLAAVGFSTLANRVRVGKTFPFRHLVFPWLSAIVAASAGVVFSIAYPAAESKALDRRFVSGMVMIIAAATCLTLATRGRALGLYGLLALAALDLHHFCLLNPIWGQPLWRETVTLQQWRNTTPLPPDYREGKVLCLDWFANQLLVHGMPLVNGYRGGIEPYKRLDYRQAASLRLSSAAWYRELSIGPILPIAGLQPYGGGWYRVPDPLSRVRLVSSTVASQHPSSDLARIDLSASALTTHPIDLDGGPAGQASLALEEPGRLRVETEALGQRLLVMAESYDPNWQLRIDGIPHESERVNGDFLGCVVEPGCHTVEFTFRPQALVYGKFLSAGGLGACLLIAFWPFWRRRALEPRGFMQEFVESK
jgi:hypothetical protein